MRASDSELELLSDDELEEAQQRATARAAKAAPKTAPPQATSKTAAQAPASIPKKSKPPTPSAAPPKDSSQVEVVDEPLADGAQAKGTSSRATATAAARKTDQQPTAKLAEAAAAGSTLTAASQKPAKQEETADDESAEKAEEQPRRRFALLRGAPSWLVSGVVHLIAFVVLAMIAMPEVPEELKGIFVAGEVLSEPEEFEILEPVQIEAVQVETQHLAEASLQSEDIGMANLGDVATIPTSIEGVTAADVDSTMDNIGMLFGDDGKGMAQSDVGMGGAEFFGVKSGGRKFVFLVDSSKSMGGGKFEDACEELQYAIRKLSKDQLFYVFFFDWNAEGMIFPPSTEPESRAAAATPQNIVKAEQWISTVQLELKTDPYEAMQRAMEMMPDAIYLLTDGIFSGKTEPYLNANNRIFDDPDASNMRIYVENDKRGSYYRPKVVIHTVGFYSDQGKELLERIAKQYGGTYRFVPQPPKPKKK